MKADHVIWDTSERPAHTFAPEHQLVMRCTHCGDRYVFGLPASLTMTGLVAKQYAKEHRGCKKAPGPPNVSPEPGSPPSGRQTPTKAKPLAKGKP